VAQPTPTPPVPPPPNQALAQENTVTGDWQFDVEIYRVLQSDGGTRDEKGHVTIVARLSEVTNGFRGSYIDASGSSATGGSACTEAEISGTIKDNQVKWVTHYTGACCQAAEMMFEGTISPDRKAMTGTLSPVRPPPAGCEVWWANVTGTRLAGSATPTPIITPTPTPACPQPTVTLSSSSGSWGERIPVEGQGWLPGGTVTLYASPHPRQVVLVDSVPVPASGAWEGSIGIGNLAGNYELAFSEDYGGCDLRVTKPFTIVEQATPTPPVPTSKPTEPTPPTASPPQPPQLPQTPEFHCITGPGGQCLTPAPSPSPQPTKPPTLPTATPTPVPPATPTPIATSTPSPPPTATPRSATPTPTSRPTSTPGK
jgi:hypothetical protein